MNRILICDNCGKLKETHGKGLCSACYQNAWSKTRIGKASVKKTNKKMYWKDPEAEKARVNAKRTDQDKQDFKDFVNIQHENGRKLINQLRINGCSECGSFDKVEFHHVMPEDKRFNLSYGNDRRSEDDIIDEFYKCILLCFKCHREVHVTNK